MAQFSENLYTADQSKIIEKRALCNQSMGSSSLMSLAGQAAFSLLSDTWPNATSILVVCGSGNNGGDAWTVASIAKKAGLDVRLMELARPKSTDAKLAAEAGYAIGLRPISFKADNLGNPDVIVDGILGIGLKGTPNDDVLASIRAINDTNKPVLALDIPSGLNPDTGDVEIDAIRASTTITFICCNPGLVTGKGPKYTGNIEFDDLGVGDTVFRGIQPIAKYVSGSNSQLLINGIPAPAHKGEAGRLLIIGGNITMGGSVRLAGEAALRTGAGLVTIGTRQANVASIHASCPELLAYSVEEGFNAAGLLNKFSHIVFGPGLGTDAWARWLFDNVIELESPIVIDADGLNLLAEYPRHNPHWILTPHPGEAARLLRKTAKEIQRDRLQASFDIQSLYGGICILKGAGTIVRISGENVFICNTGNSGMATAGTGDILSGVIGSLLAQGLSNEEAACCGVWLHGTAGDRAAADGQRGMIARDLLPALRQLVDPSNAS
ncbi:MAG: bifunctional ADP-dependent NAD(P)H-hydrate dehydratase/NAD(P)H-hydrate epimerase [Acidiferrobacteraceae bacterium]|nr:bifunctional ADP-dependent NAD(P)H-hydrate dehydratase/NAD(P)H-hydrate epimerase [Acidiferrobacteraceae bacterium]